MFLMYCRIRNPFVWGVANDTLWCGGVLLRRSERLKRFTFLKKSFTAVKLYVTKPLGARTVGPLRASNT